MECRMTVCNMSIEAGARAGMIAPDETTFRYVRGRRFAPKNFEKALAHWQTLQSDDAAHFDATVRIDAAALEPYVTWGTNPGMVVPITGRVPDPNSAASESERAAAARALEYMDLKPGSAIEEIAI